MRILVTGICGFVGRTLASALRDTFSDAELFGIDNFARAGSETNRPLLRKLGIGLFHGDLRQASDVEILPAADWVVDAAANPSVLAGIDNQTSSRQLIEHNLFGTVNILEYCKRHGSGLILLSTSRVYSIPPLAALKVEEVAKAYRPLPSQQFPQGVTSRGVSEDCSTAPPISLYGSTKIASEYLALEYGAAFGFPVWVNRCGVLAGAGQFGRGDQGIFSYWLNAWLRCRPLKYIGFNGLGRQVRDCLHPRDLVPLFVRQMSDGAARPRLCNVGGGTGNSMSLAQLSDWCGQRFGPRQVPADPKPRPFDIPWLVLDTARAAAHWDWHVTTPLEKILEEIADHAEEHPEWLELSSS